MKGITSLSVSPLNEETLYSSGMDTVIKAWKLVSYDRSPYSSYGKSLAHFFFSMLNIVYRSLILSGHLCWTY